VCGRETRDALVHTLVVPGQREQHAAPRARPSVHGGMELHVVRR
jgi:hypothetical protein